MAQITGAQNERVFGIQKWLGLHESPDGDTKLKMGEAAATKNWRITRDYNLQKRPGTDIQVDVGTSKPIDAVWTGFVDGVERVMAISDGSLWSLLDYGEIGTSDEIGAFTGTVSSPHMFGFGGKLYILTGSKYYCWDGTTLAEVDGYVPLVAISIPPDGGGELLEQVNKLNGKRRCWISPDGTGKGFPLPAGGTIDGTSVKVTDLATNTEVTTGWSYSAGVVSFTNAPAEGTNSYEIYWEVSEDDRDTVCAMRFSETYNGSQDTRVFLYGDGSSDAIYSDLDYDGVARADYFPDLNQIRIGVANTPITGMIRQLSKLIVFKTDGAWSVQFGNITNAEGNIVAGFYSSPINRTIGNEAMGQVQLVLNNPVTLFGSDVYEWKPNNYGNITANERNAVRISDRIFKTLSGLDLKSCKTYDDNYNQEYYIFNTEQKKALVWNYAADAWYCYEDFPMKQPFSYHGELYYGESNGYVMRISTEYEYDRAWPTGKSEIDCRWESGSMSFGMDYQRKYAAMIWIGTKPEASASVHVTIQTDRNSVYQEKVVSQNTATFKHANFAKWTFKTNLKPQMKRLKIKAKKFIFYKLILLSETNNTTATVTSADIRVRYTGYAK